MKNRFIIFLLISSIYVAPAIQGQEIGDSLLQQANLNNCVQYALAHQPVIQQSLLDEAITERTIRSMLADWFPQVNLEYNFQRNFLLPTSVFQGSAIKLGVNNTSAAQFSINQTLFNRDVLLASRSAKDLRSRAKQNTTENKIALVVSVSKAFYDVLLTQKQIEGLGQDIQLLQRSLKDAQNQYRSGLVDKTDYKRATISLNNANAQQHQDEELLKAKLASLKELMGYPDQADLRLEYDSVKMEDEALLDTALRINMESRIEFQLLQTQKRLQEANLRYSKWSYIPSLSAFGNYNFNWLNNDFAKLYQQNYPNAFAGLKLSFPIFQGTKRRQEIRLAELELKRVDYDLESLRNAVNMEYAQAMAMYKSNFANYQALKENLELAQDVYNTLQLQYRAGVKTYLELMVAQNDLQLSRINYINALYQVLSSKLDVQKAMGTVVY